MYQCINISSNNQLSPTHFHWCNFNSSLNDSYLICFRFQYTHARHAYTVTHLFVSRGKGWGGGGNSCDLTWHTTLFQACWWLNIAPSGHDEYCLYAYRWRADHRVHRVATAAFCRTFYHEGKISPGWCGWGVRAHPLSLHLPSPVKLQCTLQLSGQIH